MPAQDVVFQFDIGADRDRVVAALTSEAGIKGWWTDTATVPTAVGETLNLTFPGAPLPFELQLSESGPERIVWTVGGFPPPWAGTRVVWELADSPDADGVRVGFGHRDWRPDDPMIGQVAYTWGQLMVRLKDYVESGTPQPLFVN